MACLEPSPFDAEAAYAAVDRHRLDDVRPYLYRTRDGGAHWELVVTGIPDGSFVNVVRADPGRRGLLYAGTEKGVFVSFDDGEAWQPLQLGLPVTSVRDLEAHRNDVVIATHGRGFWVLDDVTPLRQLDAAAVAADALLFRPAVAVRARVAAFTGTPLPKDEPRAENPPLGAVIDYRLGADATAPVTLEVYDGGGTLVRRYSSADKVPAGDPARLHMAPQWFEPPVGLSAAAGMHRFFWPLRWAAPPQLGSGPGPSPNPWADGPWAAPGTYRLVLSAGGRRLEQPLEVTPDPRVGIPAAAYAEQLAMAQRVDALRVPLALAAREADSVLAALADRVAKAPPALRPKLAALREQVAALAGVPLLANPANAWSFPPRRLDSLRFVRGGLDALYGAIEGADAAPSADVHTGLERLTPMAHGAVAGWEALKKQQLEEANRELRRAKLPAIAVAALP